MKKIILFLIMFIALNCVLAQNDSSSENITEQIEDTEQIQEEDSPPVKDLTIPLWVIIGVLLVLLITAVIIWKMLKFAFKISLLILILLFLLWLMKRLFL